MLRSVGLIACALMILVAWVQTLSIASKRDEANAAIDRQLVILEGDYARRVALPRCGLAIGHQDEPILDRYPDRHDANQQRLQDLIAYRSRLFVAWSIANIRLTSSASACCACGLALAAIGLVKRRSKLRRG